MGIPRHGSYESRRILKTSAAEIVLIASCGITRNHVCRKLSALRNQHLKSRQVSMPYTDGLVCLASIDTIMTSILGDLEAFRMSRPSCNTSIVHTTALQPSRGKAPLGMFYHSAVFYAGISSCQLSGSFEFSYVGKTHLSQSEVKQDRWRAFSTHG